MEDFDELLAYPIHQLENQASLHRLLEGRCWVLDSQLQRWSGASGLTAVQFVESQISDVTQAKLSPTSEEFATAHLGLLYWTVCLLLYQHVCRLSRCSQTKLPERVEPRQYCRKIALLLPYFNKSNLGEFFINITAFPVSTVARFLGRHDEPDKLSEECRILQTASIGPYKRYTDNVLRTWCGVTAAALSKD